MESPPARSDLRHQLHAAVPPQALCQRRDIIDKQLSLRRNQAYPGPVELLDRRGIQLMEDPSFVLWLGDPAQQFKIERCISERAKSHARLRFGRAPADSLQPSSVGLLGLSPDQTLAKLRSSALTLMVPGERFRL